MPSEAPPLLCGHDRWPPRLTRSQSICRVCHSFWDLNALQPVEYGANYAEERLHFDPATGAIKRRTLQSWLTKTGLSLGGRSVCEVGFGGGWTLAAIHESAKAAYGIEKGAGVIEHAVALGIPFTQLFSFDQLPQDLPTQVDLWIFQDSFEHLENPRAFVQWIAQGHATTQILIVAPEAHSFSERLFGRWWPHRLKDHPFHWSKAGLCEMLQRSGFILERDFTPSKWFSVQGVLRHAIHIWKLGFLRRWATGRPLAFPVAFNLGEMGLLFKRVNT